MGDWSALHEGNPGPLPKYGLGAFLVTHSHFATPALPAQRCVRFMLNCSYSVCLKANGKTSMSTLIAAGVVFLGIHLLVSGTKLRDVIVAKIGENLYVGLFALSALGAIVWLCIAYNHAYASGDNRALYDLGQGFRNCAIPVVAFAFALAVPGVLMSNPTSARQETANVRGVLRITRHPFLWGTAIWAGYHVLASGMLASVIFFSTFLVLALLGTRAIDAKCRRRRGTEWQVLANQTSNIPFAAILAGRNCFVASEYFDWRFTVAVVEIAVFLFFHNYLFSMSPFPNSWLPY